MTDGMPSDAENLAVRQPIEGRLWGGDRAFMWSIIPGIEGAPQKKPSSGCKACFWSELDKFRSLQDW